MSEAPLNVEECLPAQLRTPSTTIARIAAGLSGAGVYRVEAGGETFVLKIAEATANDHDWRSTLEIQRVAAAAGFAPRLVHVDEGRRAVVSSFVADRGFVGLYRDPGTHAAALALLGQTVRKLQALPIPREAPVRDPRAFLAQLSRGLQPGLPLPAFAAQAIARALGEEPPADRARVLGHNDLNPTNFVYDGQAIVLLDWAFAGAIDPSYDLATLALFLRMDQGACQALLAAYDERPLAPLPGSFLYHRRLVAALAGTAGLSIARQLKHPGATGAETLASTLPLGEFYQRLRTGEAKLGTPDGQWLFGLALLKESLAV
jgi:aminoglycoside phosphotransferase (APT) family kinase protein